MNLINLFKNQKEVISFIKKASKLVSIVVFYLILISYKSTHACDETSRSQSTIYNVCIDSLTDLKNNNSRIILSDTTIKLLGAANKDVVRIVGDSIVSQLYSNYNTLNNSLEFIDKKKLLLNKKIFYLNDIYATLSSSAKSSSVIFWSELKNKYPMIKDVIAFSKISFRSSPLSGLS